MPYRYGSETRKYRPDFIVIVDDGHGTDNLLHLVVEIKGYRREDAKEKKSTMDTYWVPGINHLGTYGRWAFAEFTDVYQIEPDFKAKVESEFAKMIELVSGREFNPFTVVMNRSEASVLRQCGHDRRLTGVARSIWQAIQSREDHVFRLSDIQGVAASSDCDANEVLSLLAMLSAPSTHALRLQFRSRGGSGAEIGVTEFVSKLKDWWRKSLISDDEWERWASSVDVRWIPVLENKVSP